MVIGLNEPTPIDQIVESCRRGEADGFRALYEVYKDKVYSIALYFFHGRPSGGERRGSAGVPEVDARDFEVSRRIGIRDVVVPDGSEHVHGFGSAGEAAIADRDKWDANAGRSGRRNRGGAARAIDSDGVVGAAAETAGRGAVAVFRGALLRRDGGDGMFDGDGGSRLNRGHQLLKKKLEGMR